MRVRRAGLLPLVALLAPEPAAGQAALGPESVRFDIPSAARVGRRSAGLLCLPAGPIVWRDARPDAGELRTAFDRDLPGVGAALSARVTGVRIDGCVPRYGPIGLGTRGVSKAAGAIAIEWRDGREPPSRECVSFRFTGAASFGAVIAGAVAAAAARRLGRAAVEGGVRLTGTGGCPAIARHPPGS